jgi:hypothetical protein
MLTLAGKPKDIATTGAAAGSKGSAGSGRFNRTRTRTRVGGKEVNMTMVERLRYNETASKLREVNMRIAANEAALAQAEIRYTAKLEANNALHITGGSTPKSRFELSEAMSARDKIKRQLVRDRRQRYSLTEEIDTILRNTKKRMVKAGYKPYIPEVNTQEIADNAAAAPALARQRASAALVGAQRLNLTHRELHGPSPKERRKLRRDRKKTQVFETRGGSFKPQVSSASAGRARFGTYKRDEPTLFDSGFEKYSPDQARDDQGQFASQGGTASATAAEPASTSAPMDWGLVRDVALNAALIGTTLYGGPAVAAGARAAGRTRAGQAAANLFRGIKDRVRLPKLIGRSNAVG